MPRETNGLSEWAEARIGHEFARPELLLEALTHTTWANENSRAVSNQRLEFLGDAVVGLVVAEHIFRHFPDLPEGDLTRLRAAVVCEPALAGRARALEVGARMRFGRGEAETGRERESILADCFEALVGALFLDAGMAVAQAFVLRELSPLVEAFRRGKVRVDHKTRLQEVLQQSYTEGPTYRLLAEEGPPHNRRFHVAVFHRGAHLGSGSGRNKKEAEQEAAREALEGLGL